MTGRRDPTDVMPEPVARAVPAERYWFVIGGQAVRCFHPYRPSRDVDLGVPRATELKSFVGALRRRGPVEIVERQADTVHLKFKGVDVSVFVLPELVAHTEGAALTLTGILATKLHAILDRGTRRDFFDLYVMLCEEGLGVAECLRSLRTVYRTDVNDGLVLRALSYFDDAEREAPLPGEGPRDWEVVKRTFQRAVGALVVPPTERLRIQANRVDVRNEPSPRRVVAKKRARAKRRPRATKRAR